MMEVKHVQCGPTVNESESKAVEHIKARLRNEPGSNLWLLLTNLHHSTKPYNHLYEIDIVAIGPPGVRVVEVKHWEKAWVVENSDVVKRESELLTRKKYQILGTLRECFGRDLPFYLNGVFMVTQSLSKVEGIEDENPTRAIKFYTLKSCDCAVGLNEKKVWTREDIITFSTVLNPKSHVAVGGIPKRIGEYKNLVPQTPSDKFHRVFDTEHPTLEERVKLHLYDLSASDDPKVKQKAEREWKSLYNLYKFTWAPRIVDSFQDVPGYEGEMKFFTAADDAAPSIEQCAGDASWDIDARLSFARDAVRALREFHASNSDCERPMLHRNLTPVTILVVKRNNSPILTSFEHARIPKDVTVAAPNALVECEEQVAPEVQMLGRGAADQRSDVYSLCASLTVLFKGMKEDAAEEIAKILASGMEYDSQKRLSLAELDKRLSERLGAVKPSSSVRCWVDGQTVVSFNGNNYRIVSSLGSGGVGTAFKVVKLDRDTGKELGTYVAKVARDKETGQSVLRSYELAHPHLGQSAALSTIYEVAREWQDNSFVALMFLVDGESLEKKIGCVPTLAEDLNQESGEALALEWLRNACEGLRVLHENNLIHGDVSPQNMIVSKTKLVLTDYDCITRIREPITSPGTVRYSSPSYRKRLVASPSDDLYALGASFFHVLFDKEPFIYRGNQEKERGLNWEGTSRDDYPCLSKFLDRAADPDSAKRFATVADACKVLRTAEIKAKPLEDKIPSHDEKSETKKESKALSRRELVLKRLGI